MKTTTEATIFETLFKLTKKHVKNYKSDFEYDKKAIEKNAGKKFIHIAREHGTHLTTFHFSEEFPKKGERVIFKKYANTLVQNWENEKLIS